MLCLVLGCVGLYWAHRVLIPCTDLVPIRTGHSYSLPSSVLRLGEVRVSPGRGGKGVSHKKQPVGELGSQRRASVLGNNTLWGAGTGLEGAVGAWSEGAGVSCRDTSTISLGLSHSTLTPGTSLARKGQES